MNPDTFGTSQWARYKINQLVLLLCNYHISCIIFSLVYETGQGQSTTQKYKNISTVPLRFAEFHAAQGWNGKLSSMKSSRAISRVDM